MAPGPQEGFLDEILGALPIAVAQPQRVREESVTVFGVQRTNEFVVLGQLSPLVRPTASLGAPLPPGHPNADLTTAM